MRLIIASLFFSFSTLVLAQEKLTMKLSNPQPRVGQSIDISFDISQLNKYIDSQLNSTDDIQIGNSYFFKNDFKRTVSFKKTGEYTLGPIEFSVNGVAYHVEKVNIEVIDELPPKEGIWIRYVTKNNEHYLLVEQFLPNQSNAKLTDDSFSFSIGGELRELEDFARLDDDSTDNVSFKSIGSSRSTVSPDFSDQGFTYLLERYKVNFEDDFSGKFVLKKKHFTNLPSGVNIPKIIIKKSP